jgi:hypothetical protein
VDIFCGKEWSENMIPVAKQQEPEYFNKKVRIPGQQFLNKNPRPKSKEFPNYWKNIKGDLYQLYKNICAYTGEWFPVTSASVDHFIPKSIEPQLAYEWDNYRLTTDRMNGAKGDSTGLIDPFEVKTGWFVLVFPGCWIGPCMMLNENDNSRVQKTINVLGLNSSEHTDKRYNIIKEYISHNITFDFLKEKYPYIASEIERQNARENLSDYFKLG